MASIDLHSFLSRPLDLLKAARLTAERGEGEQPEKWAAPIEAKFVSAGILACADATTDLQTLVENWQHGARVQAQRDDLRLLVKQHYTSRLSAEQRHVFWAVPEGVQQRWRESGVLGPQTRSVPLQSLMSEMADAARLTDLLHRDTPYSEMRRLAKLAPEADIDKLALLIANETLATAIERLSSRHGDIVADAAAMEQRRHLLAIVGNIKLTTGKGRNTRLSLAENIAQLLGAVDVRREWERAAVTTTRYAYNLGVLVRLREKQVKWLAYDVQANACAYCKKLLLFPDGTSRAFSLETLWTQVAEDGGMNIGRKASAIGGADGWRVGVIIHPFVGAALDGRHGKKSRLLFNPPKSNKTLHPWLHKYRRCSMVSWNWCNGS